MEHAGHPRGVAVCEHRQSRGLRGTVPPTARAEADRAGPPPGSSGATLELRPRPALRVEARWRLGRDQPV